MKNRKKLYMLTLIIAICTCRLSAQTMNVQVGSDMRNVIVYVPENLPNNSPLMLSLHGRNQDATYQKNQAKWEPIADTAKFAVVFPNGISKSWEIRTDKDIDFLLKVIDTMHQLYDIDLKRVYLSGFSMGGMMTYFAMTKIADRVAAFAPVSGYLMGDPDTSSSRPIPFIEVHGMADNVVPYSGVLTSIDAWVKRNQCPAAPVVTAPYPADKAGSIATRSVWAPGDQGVEIVLITLKDKGHWWSTDTANGIHTSVEIWNFCKKYALDGNDSNGHKMNDK